MNPDYQQQIEDYLLGRLEPEERQNFIQLMKKNDALAEEVKIQETMLQQITDMGHIRMRKKLKKIKKKVADSSADKISKPRRRLFPFFMTAAAIALLLIIGYQVFQPSPTPQQLFAQHYEAYPLSFGNRSENVNNDLIVAGSLYQEGAFDKAVPVLKSILNNNVNTDDRVQLALGISQLETGQYQEALQTFDQIKKEAHNLYSEQAEWYSAITYLQLNELSSAQSLFNTIASNKTHYYQQNASIILSKMENF